MRKFFYRALLLKYYNIAYKSHLLFSDKKMCGFLLSNDKLETKADISVISVTTDDIRVTEGN